jgi:hypothetical protein
MEVRMTEAEWLVSFDSRALLAEVRDKGSPRIWRLFAVACARTREPLMRYPASRKALDVAERFADGRATRLELLAAREEAEEAARQAHYEEWLDEVRVNFGSDPEYEALCEAHWAADAVLPSVAETVDVSEIRDDLLLPDILREIFGNPFSWKVIDPGWLSWNGEAVTRLAQSIYENQSYDVLPILADALEDAGCTDADILGHLCSPGPHVRGCWALDLILGKE